MWYALSIGSNDLKRGTFSLIEFDLRLFGDMFDNVPKWTVGSGGGSSRLVKAKSSPNVSKAPLSAAKKPSQSSQTSLTTPNKPPRVVKAPTTSRISSKMSPNDTVCSSPRGSTNSDSSKSRLSSSTKPRRSANEARPDAAKIVPPTARNNDKRKVCKSASSSPSCTILEDRALLKKGLTYTPEKTPARPEALRRKTTLDRSVSLGCVSSENQASPANVPRGIPIPTERRLSAGDKHRKVESSRGGLTPMNRSTSLWCVPITPRADYNQCRKSSGATARPSKIPLPATRPIGLGRSLADLSQVDRVGESVGQVISFVLDLDATSDERIYENCRETVERASKLGASRISTSTSNLEERAAQLMAQLEDDEETEEPVVSVDIVDVAPPRRTEIVYEDRETPVYDRDNVTMEKRGSEDDKSNERSRSNEESKRKIAGVFKDNNTKSEEESKKRESMSKEYKSSRVKSCEKQPEQGAKELMKSEESLNIQELRRNWERHTKETVSQNNDLKTIHTTYSGKATVNLSKVTRNGHDVEIDGTQDMKRKTQCVAKKAKDIEHLVNFFNCKNAEAAKEPSRETWIKPRPVDAPVVKTPASKKNDPKSGNEYNSGYASDGNCSEDSGHMSNENEVEWKETIDNQNQRETSDFKEREYYGRIDRNNEMKNIFDSTTVVRRLAEPDEKKNANRGSPSMSSSVSSIDSCRDDRCLENGRQVRPMITVSRGLVTFKYRQHAR